MSASDRLESELAALKLGRGEVTRLLSDQCLRQRLDGVGLILVSRLAITVAAQRKRAYESRQVQYGAFELS